MKKLLLGSFLFAFTATIAQTTSGIKDNITVRKSPEVLGSVTDLARFSDPSVSSLIVTDTIRGGQFTLYTGKDAADGGMIFRDGSGNKWKRTTTDNKINVQWYGARSYVLSSPHDSRRDFIAARDYIYNHPKAFNTLYIPSDTTGYSDWKSAAYYLTDSILFNRQIKILGDGTIGYPATKILFAPHKTGFVFKYDYGVGSNFGADIENIVITAGYAATFDVTKHGIVTSTTIRINNVEVNNYDGDGLHITSCGSVPRGDNNNYGFADNSFIENFNAFYCTNGIFIEGCDANTMNITNANTSQNRRWGIYDNGFLGNIYIKPHCATNAVPAVGGNSVVTYGGLYYMPRPGYDGYFGDNADSNYNKPPDKNPAFWLQISAMGATAWNAKTRYYSGGALCMRNPNAFNNLYNVYTEAFQPPAYLNTRSKIDGGDNGAGVVGGSYHQVLYGADFIYGSNQVLPNGPASQRFLTIGENDVNVSAVLKLNNDNSKSGSLLGLYSEGSTNQIYNAFKNTSTTAAIGLQAKNFRISIGPDLVSNLNTTEFSPGIDNTQDLGTSSLRWKNFYVAGKTAIGTARPEASSVLDISSTTQGVLLPRMTKTQRNAISRPATGLMIYQTDNSPGLRVYNGSNWIRFTEIAD